jgi:hypothetical protein
VSTRSYKTWRYIDSGCPQAMVSSMYTADDRVLVSDWSLWLQFCCTRLHERHIRDAVFKKTIGTFINMFPSKINIKYNTLKHIQVSIIMIIIIQKHIWGTVSYAGFRGRAVCGEGLDRLEAEIVGSNSVQSTEFVLRLSVLLTSSFCVVVLCR